ncbi:hypothetical protein [Bradyrhizobium zhanjiangense]|uniref:hypothetical protein n=1 Tax=Bradyrhizobium zhanjiangense TaxID=1325107 RepID=UPI001FDFB837|nr:hypothetical protein [Bradyrhizobium zhanjiangense]
MMLYPLDDYDPDLVCAMMAVDDPECVTEVLLAEIERWSAVHQSRQALVAGFLSRGGLELRRRAGGDSSGYGCFLIRNGVIS